VAAKMQRKNATKTEEKEEKYFHENVRLTNAEIKFAFALRK
jgi:hypothetical protein